jgi:RND family efflux transporter MFP subunit
MKKPLWIHFLGFAMFFSAYSCKENSDHTDQENYISVETYTVVKDETPSRSEYIGIIEEDLSVSVSFPVTGNIEKIYVNEGQPVKKGDLLAELNSYSLTNLHAAALSSLRQAEDAMRRLQSLYDKNSLPEIQYIEMQTKLEQARSAEAIARKNLEDSRIYAPFSGIIGRKMADAGENILPNQAVLTVLQIEKVNIKIAVPEKEINTINIGQPATIRVSAAGDDHFEGTVSRKGVSANSVSHTYNTWILVNNQDNKLLPGMVCNVSIRNNMSEYTIVVPNHCILQDGNGNTFVWKVVNGQAKKQIIETGHQKSEGVGIISGLSIGDEIISKGYQKVSDGQKLRTL